MLARSCPVIHPGGQDHRLGTRHCLLHRPPRGHAAGAQREQRLGHPAARRPGPGLDSLDFLRFVEILSEQTGRQIAEDDYPQLATLAGAAKFLAGG